MTLTPDEKVVDLGPDHTFGSIHQQRYSRVPSPAMDLAKGDLYLGRDIESDEPVIYEADNLTTHGVIVGMTGSGKTGLGIDLIEEALLNGISCLIIDPKGDMGNLALNFPDLAASDFEPWIDEATAKKEGKTSAEMAADTAELWKNGLTGHGITQDRMRKLKENADITIYTPGSGAGVGLNVLGSMKAPNLNWETEAEVGRDEISSFVSSLLVLAGTDSDPVSGQEHILLSTIIEHFWTRGKDLDLATLVGQVPNPPFRKLGVFDIDTFFPEKDRMELALQLNGLLASPSFASWMQGRPLDIEEMIGGDSTKAAVVYMSHLSDEERQFLVTLLLGKTVTWIRSQPGTSELRAMVYMDEVFGFAPPTAEPPSKKPILTILKQARAHGVGMVLSTQNPVDLDYKAMSNSGTWMVGRLQTENDKRRIIEGLTSASGDVDIDVIDSQISDLGKRQFVLHSTKLKHPQLFGTRWAMSYLAGPLTRDQVTNLTEVSNVEEASPPDVPVATPEPEPSDAESHDTVPVAPKVADGVVVTYLDPAAPWAQQVGADPTGSRLEPGAAVTVQLTYDDTKAALNHTETYEAVIFPLDGIIDPSEVMTIDHDPRDFKTDVPIGATYSLPDVKVENKTFWSGVEGDLKNHLVANRPVNVFHAPALKLYSRVGETEEEFTARARRAAEDAADADIAKLKDKYETRIERVKDQLQSLETRMMEAQADASAKKSEEMVSGAGDILGALLGGRRSSNPLGKVASRRSATKKAEARAESAAAKLSAKQIDLQELEDDLADEIIEITNRWADAADDHETVDIPLEKSDVRVAEMKLVWVPTG